MLCQSLELIELTGRRASREAREVGVSGVRWGRRGTAVQYLSNRAQDRNQPDLLNTTVTIPLHFTAPPHSHLSSTPSIETAHLPA